MDTNTLTEILTRAKDEMPWEDIRKAISDAGLGDLHPPIPVEKHEYGCVLVEYHSHSTEVSEFPVSAETYEYLIRRPHGAMDTKAWSLVLDDEGMRRVGVKYEFKHVVEMYDTE